MSENRKTIRAAIRALGPLYTVLLAGALSQEERCRLGAALFRSAPRFVKVVAGGLAAAPDLFGDTGEDPAGLLRDQADADALRGLRAHLLLLAELAGDTHTLVQSAVLRRALQAYRHVIDGDRHRYAEDDPRGLLRQAIVRRAEYYLPARGQKGGTKKRRSLRPRRRTT